MICTIKFFRQVVALLMCTFPCSCAHSLIHVHIPLFMCTFPYSCAHSLIHVHIPLFMCTFSWMICTMKFFDIASTSRIQKSPKWSFWEQLEISDSCRLTDSLDDVVNMNEKRLTFIVKVNESHHSQNKWVTSLITLICRGVVTQNEWVTSEVHLKMERVRSLIKRMSNVTLEQKRKGHDAKNEWVTSLLHL